MSSGTISVRTDTFSFGVVLLEILTGLPPIIRRDAADEMDILSYISETLFDEDYGADEFEAKAVEHLDKHAGHLDRKVTVELFRLAERSTTDVYRERPTMLEVRKLFEENVGI